MYKCKITVVRKALHEDLSKLYENPISISCPMNEGDIFYMNGYECPPGLCSSSWESIRPFALTLAHGGENLYDGWMKNPRSSVVSCNDGIRPVSFLIEALDELVDEEI